MAEAFKNLIDRRVVQQMALHLQRVWPAFDAKSFSTRALRGLQALEFKARAVHVASALAATLPSDFSHAADLIEASLGPPLRLTPEGELGGPAPDAALGLGGWAVWPMSEYVARHGLDDPARALKALHTLTQRLTAEWALRPYIERHPQLTFATLERWTHDPSAHVRRLASEGSRPRLPWGLQLKALILDPSPTLPLLEALQDDPSAYVRRSVANHLNDIAKDHPKLIADWLERHLPGAPPPRRVLLRHASRTLIKRGDPIVLAAWGLGSALAGSVDFTLTPAQLELGDSLTLSVQLVADAGETQALEIDYAIHHAGARGVGTAKVFKGWRVRLAPGESRTLCKLHALKPVTTRRYWSGTHRVDLLINGRVAAAAQFELDVGT